MSFRKRNVGLASPSSISNLSDRAPQPLSPSSAQAAPQIPGVRPSPLDGRPTTSTGTQTLDDLFAGHAGFPLGNSILIEESGTTDFAGALLRFYAAEGVVQGHQLHVVGIGEQWGRELPGVTGEIGVNGEKDAVIAVDREKMKIAWRYEKLGEFGAGSSRRGGIAPIPPLAFYVHSSMRYTNNLGVIMIFIADSSSFADPKPRTKGSIHGPSRACSHLILPQLRPNETPLSTDVSDH